MSDVYIFNISNCSYIDLKFLSGFTHGLPDVVLKRLLKKKERFSSIIGWQILNFLKQKYNYDINTVHYGKYGKLYLDNVYFNISHSGNWVVVGISEHEIGVDIETRMFKDIYEIIELFPKEDQENIMSYSSDIQLSFKYFWSAKEAWAKKIGVGIDAIFNPEAYNVKFEPNRCNQIQCDKESILSVYSDDKDIVYFKIGFLNSSFYYY